MTSRDRIKVVCRIRPENKLEKEGNYQKCVTYDDYQIAVSVCSLKMLNQFLILV